MTWLALFVLVYVPIGIILVLLTRSDLRLRVYVMILLFWPWFLAFEGTPWAARFIRRNRK